MLRILPLILTVIAFPVHAKLKNKAVQECVCEGLRMEVGLKSGARAHYLSGTHAIEVDPTNKWAEALGKSLHYASQTGLKPKIILFCEEDLSICVKHRFRLISTIKAYGLDVDLELHDQESLFDNCPDLFDIE